MDEIIISIRQKVRPKKGKLSGNSKVESETKKKNKEPKDETDDERNDANETNEKLCDILRRKESDTAKLLKKRKRLKS